MENKNDQNEPISVPYFVYRDTISHDRWIIVRLVIALIVTVVLMFATNLVWILEWNSYDYTSDEITVDSEDNGIANYTGGDGGITIGEGDSSAENANQEGN